MVRETVLSLPGSSKNKPCSLAKFYSLMSQKDRDPESLNLCRVTHFHDPWHQERMDMGDGFGMSWGLSKAGTVERS